ncbi:hypothetical protein MKX01_018300 [Papaver californicum]|nr:hypothetical protein MKX01_018300 [Papaver californicum]
MQAARRLSFLSKNPSLSDSEKKVFYKITTAVCESNIQCSRAFAASVPPDASKRESYSKRVPLDERRGMVEAFVENYKTLNRGKFPTVTEVLKQVGGSHYTIRRLVQELGHKSKTSLVSEADQHLLQTKVPRTEDQGFTKVEEITSTEPTVDLKSHELTSKATDKPSTVIITNDVEAKVKPEVSHHAEKPLTREVAKVKSSTIIISNDLDAKEKPQVPTYVENSLSGETAKPCGSAKKAAKSKRSLGINGLKEEVVHGSDGSEEKAKSSTIIISNDLEAKEKPQVPTYVEISLSGETAKPSDTGKEAANSEGLLSLDGSKEVTRDIGQEDLEGDELSRNISSKESKEDPVPEIPNIWGKLRSFAGDVIKLWRKL